MRSESRAQDLGEVFTPPQVVMAMLDDLGSELVDPTVTVLEPSCGNGNFLVEVLQRRLESINTNGTNVYHLMHQIIKSCSTIFGVDIDEINVLECRSRMLEVVHRYLQKQEDPLSEKILKFSKEVFQTNIVIGDSLNTPHEVKFVQYADLDGTNFTRKYFFLQEPERDLFYIDPPELPNLILSEEDRLD